MIYSGLPSQSKTQAAHGVAVCLNKTATTAWKNSGSEWEPVSERILRVRIHCSPINITLIAVYAPVNPSNRSMNDNSDTFYADLQETVDRMQKGDMLLIVGDLNARLGEQEHLTAPQCVGSFTTDMQNANGVKLLDFCMMNDLLVTNTFFQHKTIHQTSWMHPGKKSWHMLDYTIVSRKFRLSVEDVRCLRRSTGAIGTDHHLMRSKIKLHLKCKKKKSQQQPQLRLDRSKMADEVLINQFQTALGKNLAESKDDKDSIDVKYEKFVKHTKETAQDHFHQDQDSQRKRKEWMTNEILEVIEKKSLSFLAWQNYRGTPAESKARRKYVALRKLVKNMVDRRQTEYWDEISLEI
jgi:exonuclease III